LPESEVIQRFRSLCLVRLIEVLNESRMAPEQLNHLLLTIAFRDMSSQSNGFLFRRGPSLATKDHRFLQQGRPTVNVPYDTLDHDGYGSGDNLQTGR